MLNTDSSFPIASIRKSQNGFTLIELMVGILVGTIVVAAAIALFVTTIRAATAVAQETRLTQEIRISMDFMVNDIRRAGYAFPHPNRVERDAETQVPINPFQDDGRDLAVHSNGECLLLSFDPTFEYDPNPEDLRSNLTDLDGTQYVFGYRLEGGAIEMLTNNASVTETTNCQSGEWVQLTDPTTTNVNKLSFEVDLRCRNVSNETRDCVSPDSGDVLYERRLVNVEIAASHAQNPDTDIALSDTIMVRNDRVRMAP